MTSTSKSRKKTAEPTAGSRRSVDRETLLQAALSLVGPNRSISTLSLREIAREACVAPNSFYRHFHDTDELAVALIDSAGTALRHIFDEARQNIQTGDSIPRRSVEIFMAQLEAEDQLLPLLLREGTVGSSGFKQAVDRQLQYFENEIHNEMVELDNLSGKQLDNAHLAARAITRLVFTMGATALDQNPADRPQLIEDTTQMVRMIIRGAKSMPAAHS